MFLHAGQEVVIFSAFEVFIPQLQGALNFELVHAAIFFGSLHVARRDEDSLVAGLRFERRLSDWIFSLPVVAYLNHTLRLSLQ